MTVFREFLPLCWIFQKTNLISLSYLPRPSNWKSMSKIELSTVATISLILVAITLNHPSISIAFEFTMARRFVKEKPRGLSLNRIAKE